MHTVNKLTYIIAYNQTIDTVAILNKQLQWLSAFSNVEIIIVEYGYKYPTLENKMGVVYKYLKVDDSYYSRSKAWNVGLKYATSDFVAFTTPNEMMLHSDLDAAMKCLMNDESLGMVKPCKRQYEIEISDYRSNISNIKLGNYVGELYEDERVHYVTSGITMWRKSVMTGPMLWEEEFKFHLEDVVQNTKLELFDIKYKVLDGNSVYVKSQAFHNDQLLSFDQNHLNKLKMADNQNVKKYFELNVGKKSNLMEYVV